jgi:hypothetical protein
VRARKPVPKDSGLSLGVTIAYGNFTVEVPAEVVADARAYWRGRLAIEGHEAAGSTASSRACRSAPSGL